MDGLHTQIAQIAASSSALTQKGGSGSGVFSPTGLFGSNGVSFFDITFDSSEGVTNGQNAAFLTQPTLSKPQKADFGKAFNFDPVLQLTTDETAPETINGLEGSNPLDLIKKLIGALPQDVTEKGFEAVDVPAEISGVVAQLKKNADHPYFKATEKLSSLRIGDSINPELLSNLDSTLPENAAFPAIIATGLTPEQLTTLQSGENAAETELDDFGLSLIAIIMPEQVVQNKVGEKSDLGKRLKTEFLHIGQDGQPASSADLKALRDIIAQLSPLNGSVDKAPQKDGAKIGFDLLLHESGGELTLRDLRMMALENSELQTDKQRPFMNISKDGEAKGTIDVFRAPPQTETAIGQLISNANGLMPWSALEEAETFGVPLEKMSVGQVLHNTAHTSPTLMHSHAAAPHQATQALAAKMTQNMLDNGDTELNIELDPPELGRVKVTMVQGKDGGIKAELSFDKPETFLMMQRDANQLEKALADAGIDIDSGSLEFSLSSDNDGENGGEPHGQNAGGEGFGAEESDTDTTEMTMTHMDWYIDTNGLLRLDMMV